MKHMFAITAEKAKEIASSGSKNCPHLNLGDLGTTPELFTGSDDHGSNSNWRVYLTCSQCAPAADAAIMKEISPRNDLRKELGLMPLL